VGGFKILLKKSENSKNKQRIILNLFYLITTGCYHDNRNIEVTCSGKHKFVSFNYTLWI